MAYQMRIDEMLSALEDVGHSKAAELKTKAEALANEVAKEMRDHFGVDSGTALFDLGETMVPFFAKYSGQTLPPEMAGSDDEDEFDFPGDEGEK